MRTRHLRITALAAMVTLALTGCMKIDMSLELNSDDTVDGSMVFAVSKDLADMMGEDGENMSEQMQEDMLSGDGPESARTEPYDDGEFVGSTMHFEGEDLEVFSGEEDGSLNIVRDDDEFVVSGAMDLSEDEADVMPGMMDDLDIQIAVTFPGEVTEHNGTLDGTTVTWTPTMGENLEMNARGSATEGGGGLAGLGGAVGGLGIAVVAGIVLLALVVIGLIVFLVVRSRRSSAPAGATAYGASGAPYPGGPEGTQGVPGGAPAGPAQPGYAPSATFSPEQAPPQHGGEQAPPTQPTAQDTTAQQPTAEHAPPPEQPLAEQPRPDEPPSDERPPAQP